MRPSKALLAALAKWVRKIAVQGEGCILDELVHGGVQTLHLPCPLRDVLKRGVELGEALHLDHHVELSEPRRGESELAPREPEGSDLPRRYEVAEIRLRVFRERHVRRAGLQIEPYVIDVHSVSASHRAAVLRRGDRLFE